MVLAAAAAAVLAEAAAVLAEAAAMLAAAVGIVHVHNPTCAPHSQLGVTTHHGAERPHASQCGDMSGCVCFPYIHCVGLARAAPEVGY